MNLSQDEIAALTASSDADSSADTGGGDMMSPEEIAAMLDVAAGGDATPAADAGGGDMMSPEAIAAMLDGAAGGDEAPAADAGGGDMMSPEAIAAMLDGAAADVPDDEAILDSLIAGAGDEEASLTTVEEASQDVYVAPLEGMLTADEIDILGEIGNISMGAVATTMYALLDKRVDITTPRVSVYETKDVLSVYQVPFVVATIKYTKGIEGTNLLVLKITDAALITDLLMGGDGTVEEPIELNEMHLSAMSEIMNQMMGASSTSLSKLLGTSIDIAPPVSTQVDVGFDVSEILGEMEMVTKISFDMEIEGLLKSELIQLAPYDVSRQFAKQFMEAGINGDPAPAAAAPPPAAAAPPPPPPMAAAPPPPPPMAAPPPPAAMPMQPAAEMPPAQPYPPAAAAPYPYPPQQPYPPQAPYPPQQPYPYPPPQAAPPPMAGQGRVVDVHPMNFQSFDQPSTPGDANSIGLVYNIPLQVSVELGKTKKEISEILEFSLGTIIVLDKVAGDPVEVIVNGKMIARGEVVVIDDNYGVRVTDIINA